MNQLTKARKRFGYKPALLVGRQFVEFTDTHLVCTDSEGSEKWRLAPADIERLAFVEHRIRGARMSRLDFLTKDRAATRSLGCNSTAADPGSDPDYLAFRDTVAAFLDRLATARPNLPVTIGEYGRARLWIFLIGVVAALFALGISFGALAGGRGDALAGEALVPVAALLLFGLYFAWSNAPWRPRPRVPVTLFAKAFSESSANSAPDGR
ncbi:MAG: hypothetical protein CL534_24540 [Ahrensia sp.]|nr:hypothetical protein [Ahrensia sp.]